MRDFHVRRTARERYAIDDVLLSSRGDLVTADLAAVRRLAERMNDARPPGAPSVATGEIAALGLLHEIGHLLVAREGARAAGSSVAAALDGLRAKLGGTVDDVLDRFALAYPGPGTGVDPPADRLEELLLTRISNENPALGPLRELVDDRVFADDPAYHAVVAGLERAFADPADVTADGRPMSLLELLRAPARHAPTSLVGQLRYVSERWSELLGADLEALVGRLDVTVGVLREEERALHLRFGGGAGGAARPQRPDAAPAFRGLAEEPEAFSSDSAWMPRVVLMAKSTYVWLDQLSRRHRREIRTLDAIPDEELDRLAGWGVTGLWLIGLWQRSAASERIKRMRGNPEAVASAYSLDDYRIADDLGGDDAHADLRDRAATRGIRLASDMVPNHMGIDSRWVVEHPDWFLALPESPYPAYRYAGPDLSSDDRVAIVLEDHYWDDSDAAVVFKRVERATGEERFVYHGNDGTSFPWNDTAQLDFLKPEVREHVIRVIIDVARRFPVIRFDAAMVLAKRHIRRLWWPEPGSGDGIPSRAEHAMREAEFDARMPVEFWREVVDRVAAEVPDTLLLAEAFWMLEGYFVRTLGMHRVYNSAFMHMFRDEDGAAYRQLIRETIEFDPEILGRYVNFMSNPDEATAVEQFGKGDKYFGVAMVLATMPGLPMLGHGQIEGFAEKYGMEFRRARLDEAPDAALVERHERELVPLLRRRSWFAEAHDFLLYDLVTDGGGVDEHVFAYSNGSGPTRSLVVFHARFGSTAGTIRESAAYARKAPGGSKRLVRRSLAEGLGLPNDAAVFVAFRDARSGLAYLRSSRDLWEHGLWLSFDAYEGHVYWEFRELVDGSAGQWRRLAEHLAGAGVPSLEDALREVQLDPIHRPLRALFVGGDVGAVLDGTADVDALDRLEAGLADVLRAVAGATGVEGDPVATARTIREDVALIFGRSGEADGAAADPRAERAAILGWLALSRLGTLAPGADIESTSAAWYDELRLGPVVAAGWRSAALDEATAWATAERIGLLLALPRASHVRGRGRLADLRLLERWLANDRIRAAMGVNAWEGVDWLDQDRFDTLVRWAVRLDAIERGAPADDARADRLLAMAAEAGYRVDALLAALRGPARERRRPGAPKGRPS